jgi:hypothetical protein
MLDNHGAGGRGKNMVAEHRLAVEVREPASVDLNLSFRSQKCAPPADARAGELFRTECELVHKPIDKPALKAIVKWLRRGGGLRKATTSRCPSSGFGRSFRAFSREGTGMSVDATDISGFSYFFARKHPPSHCRPDSQESTRYSEKATGDRNERRCGVARAAFYSGAHK